MIPRIQRRSGWLMDSGVLNFLGGHYKDTPVQIVNHDDIDKMTDVVLGYVICDHTACCRHHNHHTTPHTRCILR